MAKKQASRGVRQIINLVLLLVIVLIAWTVGREVFHLGQPAEEGKRIPVAMKLTPSDLGQAQWAVGSVTLKKGEGLYEVTIMDQERMRLFKLKLDAVSGQPIGGKEEAKEEREGEEREKGEEEESKRAPTTGQIMSPDAIELAADSILDQLTVGSVTRKAGEPFYHVALNYGGLRVADVRVDPATKRILSPGPPSGRGREREREEAKLVAKNLVEPLGWMSGLLAVIVTLYYSFKRSLLAPLSASEGPAKAKAAAGLRRTLNYHCILSLIALVIAVFHVLNFWGKVRLSVSFLALAMMITVVVSGTFGKYFARSAVVRGTWRRFHVPYTILFFFVLMIHVLQKIHLI
ncbi:MAG: hypothetical protein ACE5NP_13000 [Anaerolineae bacterium]